MTVSIQALGALCATLLATILFHHAKDAAEAEWSALLPALNQQGNLHPTDREAATNLSRNGTRRAVKPAKNPGNRLVFHPP